MTISHAVELFQNGKYFQTVCLAFYGKFEPPSTNIGFLFGNISDTVDVDMVGMSV